jgi:hypothetical protein
LRACGYSLQANFIYDAEHDHYTCPAGAKLTKTKRRADHMNDVDVYRHLSACFTCPLRPPVHADQAAAHQALGE